MATTGFLRTYIQPTGQLKSDLHTSDLFPSSYPACLLQRVQLGCWTRASLPIFILLSLIPPVMFSSEKKEASIGSKAVQDGPYHSSSPSSISHEDVEGSPVPGTTVQLKRRLQSRHLQMIAIGKNAAFLSHHRTKL
jgi:hypothetical protein